MYNFKAITYCIIIFNSLIFWLDIILYQFSRWPCDSYSISVLILGPIYYQISFTNVQYPHIFDENCYMPPYTTATIMLLCKCIGSNKLYLSLSFDSESDRHQVASHHMCLLINIGVTWPVDHVIEANWTARLVIMWHILLLLFVAQFNSWQL